MTPTRTRVDWWSVMTDLMTNGYSLVTISEYTLIPRATLSGYRNLDVEPRHSDGEVLVALWQRAMKREDLPTKPCKLRQGTLEHRNIREPERW